MDRKEELRKYVSKTKRGIEIGPYHNPIVPKRLGFNSISLDIYDRATLRERAKKDPLIDWTEITLIEEPELVGSASNIKDLVTTAFGNERFDYIVSSHNLEHIPNPIQFLQGCEEVLNPGGVLSIAVPDRRCCFDFFRPVTTLGEWLEAFFEHREIPTLRQRFDFASLFAVNDQKLGWSLDQVRLDKLPELVHDLSAPFIEWRRAIDSSGERDQYHDVHCSVFTPFSLQLLIEGLAYLGLINLQIIDVAGPSGLEFFVHLKHREAMLPTQTVELRHHLTNLSQQMIRELAGPFLPKNANLVQHFSDHPKSDRTIVAIIALYNGRRWIAESLQSIIAQTRQPDEIIIVDDGSTDDGTELVVELARTYPVRLLRKSNGGQSAARNYGVANSTATLIAFLDQDDVWYPRHLERLEEAYEKYDGQKFGWTYSNVDRIDEDGSILCKSFLDSLDSPHPKRDVFSCLRCDMFILPSAALLHRRAFESVGGFDLLLSGYEDDDLFLRMFRKGYDGVYVQEALSQWRIFSSSSSYSFRMTRSRKVYAEKLIAAFPDRPSQALYFARDVIVPRFIRNAAGDLNVALRERDKTKFRSSVEELRVLSSRLRPHQRLLWQLALCGLWCFPVAYVLRYVVRFLTVCRLLGGSVFSPIRSMTN